jgi:glyoxylase-like metal-dependent hydrolase (beta-lactamase superfamily II)
MATKIVWVITAIVLGTLGAVVQQAQQAGQQQQRPPVEIQQIKQGLYLITGAGGNISARVTDEGVILVDDKFEQDYAAIIDKLKTVTQQPVKYVINTHNHGDHTGSNAQFLRIAEIIAHKNARANMMKAQPPQPGPPRIVFTDQTAVFLGGAEVQAHYLGRGHTNGDAVIYFPDLRVVSTGDLVNEAGPFADYGNGGSVAEWTATFDNILKLDFDTVIPGHGRVMTKPDLQTYRNRMNTLVTRLTEAIRSGATKENLAARLKTDDLVWNLGPQSTFMSRSLSGAYDEVAARR